MSTNVRGVAGSALRARRNWHELAKFCVVGGIGYAVNLIVYSALLHAHVHYLLAASCSFLVAVVGNYTLNRVWTFRERRGNVAAQGSRFFVVSLASLAANLLSLHTLILMSGSRVLAQSVAILLVTPLNFLGNRLWSFRASRSTAA